MPTPSALGSLPSELALCILQCLDVHDLVNLMPVSKGINALVQPLLWSSIELHMEGYHGSLVEPKHPPPFISTPQRRYHPSITTAWDEDGRAGDLLTMLKSLETNNKDRLRQVAERVVNLCTIVDPSAGYPSDLTMTAEFALQCWNIMTYFTKLESLELHAIPVSDERDDHDMPPVAAPALPNLRFAKLFGYIPPAFVAWILQSGATLERLELQLLDRPITNRCCYDLDFNALPEENLRLDEKGEDGEDVRSDYGSIYGNNLVPRSLGRFLPANIDDNTLPNLKHLYLSRPSKHDTSRTSRTEWGKTLEVLVLEQMPVAASIEDDGWSSSEFLTDQLARGSGIGSASLVDMAKEVLLQQGAFPNLKKVYLYGIPTCREASSSPSNDLPGGQLMWLLKDRGVRCEARLGTWLRFDEKSGKMAATNHEHDCSLGDQVPAQRDTLLASV